MLMFTASALSFALAGRIREYHRGEEQSVAPREIGNMAEIGPAYDDPAKYSRQTSSTSSSVACITNVD